MNADAQLINAAKELVDRRADDKNHTVAAAILTKSGKIITSMNLYHFTGGPCAEIAALARVVSEGEEPIKIVAVGHDARGVLPPCGRCRQTMFDYYPDIQVVVSNDGRLQTVEELMPDAYIRRDQHSLGNVD